MWVLWMRRRLQQAKVRVSKGREGERKGVDYCLLWGGENNWSVV
jgi:hypothetical protein